jgi:hypothetical protein
MIDMDALAEPTELEWRMVTYLSGVGHEVFANGQRLGWLERRPDYCDRGRWAFNCELPDLDAADAFPRYYMSLVRAFDEASDWLRWRLWKEKP